MLGSLALLFIVVPLLELVLLVQIGQWVGLLPTVGLVILTGVVGAALARAEGLRTLAAVQAELARGRMPGGALLDGLAILVGGAFLLTPGILTDLAGFSLLLPPTRRLAKRRARRWLEQRIESGALRVTYQGPLSGWPPGTSDAGLDPRNEIKQEPEDPRVR